MVPNLPIRIAPQLADFDTFQAVVGHPTIPNGSLGVMPAFPPAKIPEPRMKDLYQYIAKVLKAPKRE